MQQADRGVAELMDSVDTTIVIPNEKLLAVAQDAGFFESFRVADDILRQGVQGISDIITIPGIINRDFADVKTVMKGMGYALMGTAIASGERYFMLTYHSSSLLPGANSYVRNGSERREFLSTLDRYLAFFIKDCRGTTKSVTTFSNVLLKQGESLERA